MFSHHHVPYSWQRLYQRSIPWSKLVPLYQTFHSYTLRLPPSAPSSLAHATTEDPPVSTRTTHSNATDPHLHPHPHHTASHPQPSLPPHTTAASKTRRSETDKTESSYPSSSTPTVPRS